MKKVVEIVCKLLVKWCEATGRVFYIKGGPQNTTVYLARYIVFKSKYGCIYIHRFMRSDSDVPHDHPWNFFTYVISGGYLELFYDKTPDVAVKENIVAGESPYEFKAFWRSRWIKREPGSIAYRNATDIHQVVVDKSRDMDEIEDAPFTVCIIGPRLRDWGFWTDSATWVDWRKYLNIQPNDPRTEGSE